MRVISLNVNGIRSAASKGFFRWLKKQEADVVCLQEVRASWDQLSPRHKKAGGLHTVCYSAERAGYSGVAILSRREPDRVVQGFGWPDVDIEARYVQADFGKLSVASVYVPSGTSSQERLAIKFKFLERFLPYLKELRRKRRQFILCGDWNIAHKEIDLTNWRANRKHSGFLPEERAWLDQVFGEAGFHDAFRLVNKAPEQYTWWSNRGQAWKKNVGWRIDYQVVTPGLKRKVKAAQIYKASRFSDHAPLIMDYDVDLEASSSRRSARAAHGRSRRSPHLPGDPMQVDERQMLAPAAASRSNGRRPATAGRDTPPDGSVGLLTKPTRNPKRRPAPASLVRQNLAIPIDE